MKIVFFVQDIIGIGNIFFLESRPDKYLLSTFFLRSKIFLDAADYLSILPLKVNIKVALLDEVSDLVLSNSRDITTRPAVERPQIWRNFQKV